MTEINENDTFSLTGDMVTVTYNKNNDQVISGMSNYEMGQHGGEFLLDIGQNDKTLQNNVFSKTMSLLYKQKNDQDMNMNPQMLPYENSNYRSEFRLQQNEHMNNAENTFTKNIKPEIFNISSVYETNGLQSQYDVGDMINTPVFKILPPKKDKNPPYVISYASPLGPVVTAKRKAPVRMSIKMAESYNCKIYLRYDDLTAIDKPVNICNKVDHQKDVNIAVDPKPMFIVKGHNAVEYEIYEGHPCCRIDSEGEYIIQFLCWNSCDQNRSNKKDMSIYVRFYDNASGIYSNEKITLRVAENVKREAGITGPARVRKRSTNEEFPEIEATKMIVINEESDEPSTLSPQPLKKQMICIQVDSQKHVELYKLLAESLGNDLNIIQVDDMDHLQG